MWVTQIGVVFLHKPDHPVVPEPDLLELIVSEVISVLSAMVLESVENSASLLLFRRAISFTSRPKFSLPSILLGDGQLQAFFLLCPAYKRRSRQSGEIWQENVKLGSEFYGNWKKELMDSVFGGRGEGF
ncbi:hypothetical protein PS1_007757 [Malus domestica]